jgi:2-hydroxy-3-keto-5-methylthiopentenyl-1-phosphate phosphatase
MSKTDREKVNNSMGGKVDNYHAAVSSDWSECLSPNGPFDAISFAYPELESELSEIFQHYTGNRISLTQATGRIVELLPEPITVDQMDAYLDQRFQAYPGVPDLIDWCLGHDILFMINTTGTQGYFQRAFANGLLPRVPVVAANPMIRFHEPQDDRRFVYQILEIEDKPKRTAEVIRLYNLPPERLIIMGDSGGDGAHFEWGGGAGAFLVGNMTKDSLERYCRSANVSINKHFGISYGPGEKRDVKREMEVNFMELAEVIRAVLNVPQQ